MSNQLMRSLPRFPRPWPRPHGLAATLLLSLALAPLPGLADAPAARRVELRPEEAQALLRLHPAARRDYFEARRQLERSSSEQRLAQLRQLEDCLSFARQRSVAETCLTQAQQRQWQQRRQGLAEQMSLRQRYGLPDLRPWQQRSLAPVDPWSRPSLSREPWSPEGPAPQRWNQESWTPQPSGWQTLYEALLPFGLF